jgi:putative aldouronate transport system substrate-binding protein
MGAYHPDVSLGPGAAGNDFAAGKFATICQGFGNQFREILRRGLPAGRHFAFLPPIAHDGSNPINFLGPGYISTNALKAAPPERIKELLRIIDWLASPFGSQEDVLLSYGIQDQDYTLDDKGNPVPSQEGLARTQQVPWQYVLQHPLVLYQPDLANWAKMLTDQEHLLIPTGVENPTLSYYSVTNYAAGVAANRTFSDGVNDIVVGRRPLSDYDQLVKTWQAAAGEQIRKEYLDAMAAAA